MEKQKTRLPEFDILKGIGIILVLLGHLPISSEMHMVIYSFHMPLFFFCSGVFFHKRAVKESMIKDVKSILIPYAFFAVILIVTLFLVSLFHTYSISVALSQIKIVPFDRQCYSLYHTIWFFVCIYFVKEIFNVFYKSPMQGLIIGGVIYIVSLVLQQYKIHLPFFIDSSLGMISFYSIGFYLHHFFVLKQMTVTNKITIGALLLFVCYVCVIILVKPYINVRDNEYPCFLVISALIPILSLYILSKKISESCSIFTGIIKICGVNSLFLFALHGPIYEILFPIVNKVGLGNLSIIFVMLVITIPTCLMAAKLLLKYTPFLVGNLK